MLQIERVFPHFHQNIIILKENFKPFVPKPLQFI